MHGSYGIMIPEIDIWRAATVMLKRYGESVWHEAARRAVELFDAGDVERMAMWRENRRGTLWTRFDCPTVRDWWSNDPICFRRGDREAIMLLGASIIWRILAHAVLVRKLLMTDQ